MKLPRRKLLRLAAGAAALPLVPSIARAQSYPTRPVRIIVGFAAGGPNDVLARMLHAADPRNGAPGTHFLRPVWPLGCRD